MTECVFIFLKHSVYAVQKNYRIKGAVCRGTKKFYEHTFLDNDI